MSGFEQDIKGGEVTVLETPQLPPGFRFHPTDEELVSFYLTQKVLNGNFVFQAIGEVDFNKCEPWDLREKAKMSESMFYFFSLRDRKYPTGMRTNRATEAGYWKATGKDRDVMSSSTGRLVGMKKTLVFYTGRAPKGEKTNWIMHEYRLSDESTPHQQEWVVCRVFEKSGPSKSKVMLLSANSTCENMTSSSSYTAQFGAHQSLPGLQNLEGPPSPNSAVRPSYMYTGLALSDPLQGNYFQGATIPGHEMILRRTLSSMSGRRDSLQLGECLDTLLSGWENMYPPEWTGDASH
ncbi:unnamed protein product [Calypogeia fissa]